MHRITTARRLALWTIALVLSTPAFAEGDTQDLQRQLDDLKQQVAEMKVEQNKKIEKEIEAYLDSGAQWSESSQGEDNMRNITIGAGLLAVNQNTVNLDSGDNRSVVNGRIELMFNFKVSDRIDLFTDLVANTSGHFEDAFANGPTLAGAFDNIGVDSSTGVRPQGGVQVKEAGIRYAIPAGNFVVNMELGLLDPRRRFLTNPFTDDYRTTFLHNEFVDPSGINWISNGNARQNTLGAYFWSAFGENKNIIVRLAWFNAPGRWFDNGQFIAEIHWKGEVRGREMNVKFMYVRDGFYQGVNDKDDNNWGVNWNWMATDNLGVWITLSGNTEDTNNVEFAWSVGGVWTGVGQNRPDDQIGLAIGQLSRNSNVNDTPKSSELALEIYYKFMVEDGKFQITPHVMWINDPGAGEGFGDKSSLWILGVRIYVPF